MSMLIMLTFLCDKKKLLFRWNQDSDLIWFSRVESGSGFFDRVGSGFFSGVGCRFKSTRIHNSALKFLTPGVIKLFKGKLIHLFIKKSFQLYHNSLIINIIFNMLTTFHWLYNHDFSEKFNWYIPSYNLGIWLLNEMISQEGLRTDLYFFKYFSYI